MGDGEDDRGALRALVDGYAFAADRRDVEAFVGLFTPDAVLTTVSAGTPRHAVRGTAELAALLRALGRYHRTLHLVAGHRYALDGDGGDGATGEATCEAHHLTLDPADPGHATDRVLAIRYLDRYVRSPAGWRFAAREVHVEWADHRRVVLGDGGGIGDGHRGGEGGSPA